MRAEYIDHMGTDLTVVNAARVSFKKESQWENAADPLEWDELPGVLSEKDAKLIRYLSKNGHFTPFTHCVVTVREYVPIFVARQRFKHTIGFSYNEVSRRYVDDTPEFFQPKEWRGKAKDKKQGSSDQKMNDVVFTTHIHPAQTVVDAAYWSQQYAVEIYEGMIKAGVAPEQARMILPQSMYTEYYVTGSLFAWARAYNLRSDEHAQKETQELAQMWDNILRPLFPVSWEALTHGNS